MEMGTEIIYFSESEVTPRIDTVELHLLNYSSAVDERMTDVIIP